MGIVHADVFEMADRPVGSVITVRGKELAADATVGDARDGCSSRAPCS